jgi:asparagine synthetase B (glutamine-hydrolysing)
MCGIAGMLRLSGAAATWDRELLTRMTTAIGHRDRTTRVCGAAARGARHRRLS